MEKKNITHYLLLIFTALCIVFSFFTITGAVTGDQSGRFQLQAVVRGNFVQLYVIDTSTGRVKWVGAKDENKPFEQIKSK